MQGLQIQAAPGGQSASPGQWCPGPGHVHCSVAPSGGQGLWLLTTPGYSCIAEVPGTKWVSEVGLEGTFSKPYPHLLDTLS